MHKSELTMRCADDKNRRDKRHTHPLLRCVYTSFVTDFHLFFGEHRPPPQVSPGMVVGECFWAWLQGTTKISAPPAPSCGEITIRYGSLGKLRMTIPHQRPGRCVCCSVPQPEGSDLPQDTHSWLVFSPSSSTLPLGSKVCVHRSWNDDHSWPITGETWNTWDSHSLNLSLVLSLNLSLVLLQPVPRSLSIRSLSEIGVGSRKHVQGKELDKKPNPAKDSAP